MSVLLVIETSQRIGGVALRGPTGAVHVEMLAPRKRHDDDLMPAIDRVFRRAGLQPRDLQGGAVGVSIGPGGFTGLRIAVSTAKMLAETLNVKLLAVPSALVGAESTEITANVAKSVTTAANGVNATVMLACKNESCWCTRVRKTAGEWKIQGNPGLCTASTLDLNQVQFVLADEHLPEPMRQLCEKKGVAVIEPAFDPRACLKIAERMLRHEQTIEALSLVPLYPREPEAVTLWRQRTGKG